MLQAGGNRVHLCIDEHSRAHLLCADCCLDVAMPCWKRKNEMKWKWHLVRSHDDASSICTAVQDREPVFNCSFHTCCRPSIRSVKRTRCFETSQCIARLQDMLRGAIIRRLYCGEFQMKMAIRLPEPDDCCLGIGNPFYDVRLVSRYKQKSSEAAVDTGPVCDVPPPCPSGYMLDDNGCCIPIPPPPPPPPPPPKVTAVVAYRQTRTWDESIQGWVGLVGCV